MYQKIVTALRNPQSLSGRALNASMWNVLGLAVQYPLRLGSNLVLTRLLAPEAFGLMAVIMTLHMGLMLLSDVGIVQSVMRDRHGASTRFLRVAWTAQVLRGLAITAVLMAIGFGVLLFGPTMAPDTVYADPVLPWLIWVSGLALLMRGVISAKVLLARRQMRLKGVIALDMIGQAVGITAMVGLGLWFGTVWALLVGMLIGSAAYLIASYRTLEGPGMRLVWDRTRARAMWVFGRWIILSSIGGFLLRHGDRLLFSFLIEKTLFGIYAIAILWVEIGITLLLRVGSSVFMPVFSTLIHQDRTADLKATFRKLFGIYAAIAFGMLLGYMLVMDHLIAFLYTPEYHLAGALAGLAAVRLLFMNAQVVNEYVVATGASLYSAFAHLAAAGIAFTSAILAYHHISLEAAIMAFAAGNLTLLVLLQFHRGYVDTLGNRRTLAITALSVLLGLATLTLVDTGQAGLGDVR
ncbi:MAG: oligosaccharide flippase family protein [Pseudomonadota bacterium]